MSLLEIRNLKKYFPVKSGFLRREVGSVKALDGVSFAIERGETFGLVGESGCGKSSLGRTLLRIHAPTSGEVLFREQDVDSMTKTQLKTFRKDVQMIFQDPASSLDPRMTVGQSLSEPFQIQNLLTASQRLEKVAELLKLVGLDSSFSNRFPHEFSGGQKQRICIARALALSPSLIICDEPVSALDVSIQAQILNLLSELQKKLGLTYLFISHDLGVIEHFCNRVAVMYLGKIVEVGATEDIFDHPQHPYTQALIAAVPQIGAGKVKNKRSLQGEVPSPLKPPPGCTFHPRCAHASDRCKIEIPALMLKPRSALRHEVACHLVNPSYHLELKESQGA